MGSGSFAGKLTLIAGALIAGVSLAAPQARAQQYPTRAVKIIVPFTVGTGYDLIARVVASGLQARLDKPFVVENVPGAGSVIGAAQIARAAPDGYTIGMIGEGTIAAARLMKSTQFNALTDVKPILVAGFGTLLLLSGKESGIKDVGDLIAKAKASPQPLNYGSPGVGQTQHLRMEIFKNRADVPLRHIPYKGSAPALTALLNGEVSAALTPVHQVTSHLSSGNVVALAVLAEERDPRAPQVPTMKELGIAGLDSRMWYSFAAPAKTPQAILDKLQAEITLVLQEPNAKKQLEATGLMIDPTTADKAADIIRAEAAIVDDIIARANITME